MPDGPDRAASVFKPRISPPLRLAIAAGGSLRRVMPRLSRWEPDALIEEATRASGLLDFGFGHEWREALGHYTRSLGDARLHVLGAVHVRDMARRALIDRLRLAQARSRIHALGHPPLVVCGLPRSGTTFLHRMLAEAEHTRALPLWELMEPIPGPGPDRRLERARRRISNMRRFTPVDMDAIHLVRPELPDECGWLFKSAFRSAFLWQAPAISWLDWHIATPAFEAYRDWRDCLSLLEVPGHRFVLKDPFHVGHLPELFAAVPDAMVVRTHRDPLETLPSYHKLTLNMQAVLSDPLDIRGIVEANTRWQLSLTNRATRLGEGVPKERVYDADYRRLVADPAGVMRDIHAHFGLAWDEALAARISRYVSDNGQRKFGDNPYALADFGQDEAELRRGFAPYREAFGLDRPLA